MALDFLLGDSTSILTHDQYTAVNNNQVEFRCKNKGDMVIKAVLSGSFNLTVVSHWDSVIKATGPVGSQVVEIFDNFAQGLYGNTIRQPWFGRKFWQGTDPLKFTLPLQFLSFTNAKEEVFKPMVKLLSLVYPRLDSKSSTATTFQKYFIPGPTMFYVPADGHDADLGDRVEISMGNFLSFKGCYITQVALKVENSFSLEGYPHNVHADVSFETMDVSYVNPDGSFMTGGFRDASITMDGWLNKLIGTVKKFTSEAGKALADATGMSI